MAQRRELQDKVLRYRWVVMGLWLVCSVVGYAMVLTLGVLLPVISLELRLAPSQQGWLSSAAFLGSLALPIPLTWWISRYRPKMLTTITLVIGTLFLFFQGWAPGFVLLVVGRLGFGITLLAREPARALLMQQWFPSREFILVNSVSNAIFGLVVGGGLAATPFILSSAGDNWRTVFYAFGVLFMLLTFLWLVLGRDRLTQEYRKREVPRKAGLLRGALTYRDLWVSGFGFLGATLAWSAFLTFFPTLMLDTYEVSLQSSGIVLAVGILVGGISGLGVGYTVMTVGKRKGILLALGILMTGTYVGMTLVGSIALLAFLSFLNGIAWGFWPILHTVPFQLPGIRPREVAVALAFIVTMMSVGTALGPLVTGFLQEFLGDLRPALLIISFAALSLSAAGTLLRVAPQEVTAKHRAR